MKLSAHHQRKSSNHLAIALYLNAAALGVIAIVLLSRNNAPSFLPAAFGQNQPAIGGGAGVFVMPAQFSTNTYGCYLMDIDAQTLCAYQWTPGNHQLALVAARSFRYDRRLTNYNTENPSPAEVQKMIDAASQSNRVKEVPTDHAPVEPPKNE